jgi:hypothetical protein
MFCFKHAVCAPQLNTAVQISGADLSQNVPEFRFVFTSLISEKLSIRFNDHTLVVAPACART